MEQLIPDAVVPVATVVLIAIITAASRRSRPLSEAESTVTITPGKFSAWFVVLFFGAAALGGVGLVFVGQTAPDLLWIGLGGTLAAFMAPSLTHIHDVSWSEEGLSGPSKMFGLALGTARTHIPWKVIATSGMSWSGYWFVQADHGRRVYWNFLYPGFGRLVAELRARRPDVVLPDDLGG